LILYTSEITKNYEDFLATGQVQPSFSNEGLYSMFKFLRLETQLANE
jgi:hypothetical protein